MKRLLPLLLCLMLLPAALADNCRAAREKAPDYAVQPAFDTPAGDEIFANALLIGDSIAGSVVDYNAFPALTVEACIGISPVHAHKARLVVRNGGYMSLYQIALEMKPGRLYLLLGSNALGAKPARQVLPEYHDLVDDLIRNLPDTQIYLLSVTPVGNEAGKGQRWMTNDNISEFNTGLLEMAESHGVYYIDAYTPLLDESGQEAHPDNVANNESIHLTREGINILVETIRLHTCR